MVADAHGSRRLARASLTPLLNPLLAYKIARTSGVSWVATRLKLAARELTGGLKRATPPATWQDFALPKIVREGAPHQPLSLLDWKRSRIGSAVALPIVDASATVEADKILRGEFRFFSGRSFAPGFPPDWRLNPYNGKRSATNVHWSQTPWSDAGDIKCVWELSRFTWAFQLCRAYAATGGEQYASAFWTLLEDWCANNPPNAGVQWKCGQEAALRLIATTFAATAFRDAAASTPKRKAFLTTFAWAHAGRIAAHIDYALSQNNNHGLSEAAGLYTAGICYPELRRAVEWREQGKRLLEQQVAEQIYADGSYIQHSFNYQRLALSLLLWCLHIGKGELRISEAVQRSADMLAAFSDPRTGEAPNTGSNDGALLFPLTACDHADHRPVLQWATASTSQQRRYPSGPWDELTSWFMPMPVQAAGATAHVSAPVGGCYSVWRGETRAMVRCADYRHRPAHADQLHVDLWHRGKPLTLDAGTYAYNDEPGWENELARSCVHNTVTVDHRDQMTRASKFLWLDWAPATALHSARHYFEGEHRGYQAVTHRRGVAMPAAGGCLVIDDLLGDSEREIELHWLLSDGEWVLKDNVAFSNTCTIRIDCTHSTKLRLIRDGIRIAGEGTSPDDRLRGCFSPTYRRKVPAVSLIASLKAKLPIRFESWFHFSPGVQGLRERLQPLGSSPILREESI